MLKSTDYLLLTLTGVVDMIDSLPSHRDVGRFAWRGSPPTYKKETLTRALYRQLSTANIEKVVRKGEIHYKITTKGFNQLQRLFPASKFTGQKWDHKWRLVIFDVEEKHRYKREMIRNKLQELGFAMLQKSVWVSPHDIENDLNSFLEAQRLKKGVLFLTASKISVDDQQELVEKLWGLTELNESYNNLLEKWEKSKIKFQDRPKLLRKQAAKWEQQLYKILLRDPHLPKSLLPPGEWYGKTARELYKKEIRSKIHNQ